MMQNGIDSKLVRFHKLCNIDIEKEIPLNKPYQKQYPTIMKRVFYPRFTPQMKSLLSITYPLMFLVNNAFSTAQYSSLCIEFQMLRSWKLKACCVSRIQPNG